MAAIASLQLGFPMNFREREHDEFISFQTTRKTEENSQRSYSNHGKFSCDSILRKTMACNLGQTGHTD